MAQQNLANLKISLFDMFCKNNISKYAICLALSLSLLLICATASAQSKEDVKRAIQDAENISNLLYLDSDAELLQQSYLLSVDEIVVSDKAGLSFSSLKTAMIAPGTYTFGVQRKSYVTMTSGSQASSGNVSIGLSASHSTPYYGKVIEADVTFEPGKCYVLEIGRNKDKSTNKDKRQLVSAVEVNDTDLLHNLEANRAAVAEYLAWSKANPNILEGTYKQGKREITFTGSKVSITSYIFGVKYIYEGRFWFNENTIIVYTDSRQVGKSPVHPYDRAAVWYYTSNRGSLTISGNIPEGGFTVELTGVYTNGSAEFSEEGEEDGGMVASLPEAPGILWEIRGQTLTVSGEGDIPNNPSWARSISDIDSVVIEDNITSLGNRAFAMAKFSSIVLGKDVTQLKTYALFNCNNLTLVEVKSSVPPKVGSFVFMSTPTGKAKLIVPAGSKAVYEKDKDWKKFGTIEER